MILFTLQQRAIVLENQNIETFFRETLKQTNVLSAYK